MLQAEKYLRVIQSRGERRLPLQRMYHNMRQRDLFLRAYAKIYANQGATTVGTDPQDTIQGMSRERIDAILEQLRQGTYHWKPNRRTYVPKSNGSPRPISMPNWSDKLVQEVMRMILEAYYEPRFRDSSHGFRPNRACHTALQDIKHSWTGTVWFIEGDISGCFDNISQEALLAILSRDIQDNRFLKLVKEMLQAGYMDDWQYHKTYSGVPQGGIVSPVLSNIVLNELDSFVEDVLIPKYSRGERRRVNPEYDQLLRAKRRAQQQGDKETYQALWKQQRSVPSVDPHDPNYRRLRYVRYADDWLLGFVGPKEEAKAIKAQVGEFLRTLGLTLSEEKTKITHAGTQAARFLGYDIKVGWNDTKMSKRHTDGGKIRSLNGRIQLYVPQQVRTKWLRRYTRQGKPYPVRKYQNLSDYEIVQTLGAQIRGLVNYYALAVNLGACLNAVRWACMESARKTLAAKHKIRQPSVTHRRYYHESTSSNEGKHIRVVIERDGKPPLVAKCGETPLRTRQTTYQNDTIPPMIIAGMTSELLTRLLKGECELCGCQDALQAHHINKLKHLRKRWAGRREKPAWVQFMLARRRKTVVVCYDCHQLITQGKYDGRRVA